jgi:glycosyltransferase involved in cell wall biosynthesis
MNAKLPPRISVIITSYNQRDFLAEAIDSVLSQTLRPWEILIADDHSTDGSDDLIRGYVDRNPGWVKALIQPRNVGVAKNKNLAVGAVQGDLVTLLDGDDRFLPWKLEREYETYRTSPDARVVHSDLYYINIKGRRIRQWADGRPPPQGDVFAKVLARRYPRGTTFRNELVETQCIREVGGYDESLPRYTDWDLIIRLTRRFRTAYCPEPLTEYRRHPDSLSHAPGPVHIASVTQIYEKYRPSLADLPERDRADIEAAFRDMLARLTRRSAMEAMDARNRRAAFEYWARSLPLDHAWSPVLLGRILLPMRAYALLRSLSRGIVSPQPREAHEEPV